MVVVRNHRFRLQRLLCGVAALSLYARLQPLGPVSCSALLPNARSRSARRPITTRWMRIPTLSIFSSRREWIALSPARLAFSLPRRQRVCDRRCPTPHGRSGRPTAAVFVVSSSEQAAAAATTPAAAATPPTRRPPAPAAAAAAAARTAGEGALRRAEWLGQLLASDKRASHLEFTGGDTTAAATATTSTSASSVMTPGIFELADTTADNNAAAAAALAALAAASSVKVAEKVAGLGGTVYTPTTTAAGSATTTTITTTAAPPAAAAAAAERTAARGGTARTRKQRRQGLDKDERKFAEEKQVWAALASLEKDMQLLDRLAGNKPQLSVLELSLLIGAVVSSAGSPLVLAGHLTGFIAPAAAAVTAAIGIAAEYTGKVAVADGKEVAAASLQCAAEAEGFLAGAERAKAITPLCVGVGATSATLALLVPVLLDNLGVGNNLQLVTEIYLLCPLVAVLAAAVAGLALQETKSLCNLAIGVGNRRFARSGMVSRTWLSSTELIERKSKNSSNKWRSFSLSVLPAPLLGALCPGALPTKTIVVAALAAAESAYYLAQSEYTLARATDAVALKARSAAVCDTYANQGARSAAILPFTSALSGLCAAATAAIVELPFVESLAKSNTVLGLLLEICTVTAFPALSALFAAAASVSKARCEVDAEAAMQAASTIALPYNGEENDPVLRPLNGVKELILLTISNSIRVPLRRLLRRFHVRRRWRYFQKLLWSPWRRS